VPAVSEHRQAAQLNPELMDDEAPEAGDDEDAPPSMR
jgi:hypothetical protein